MNRHESCGPEETPRTHERCGSPMCDLGKMRRALAGLARVETISAERSNPFCAEVAQLVEHSPEKAGVDSSILSLGTTFRILRDSDSLASGTQVAVTGT